MSQENKKILSPRIRVIQKLYGSLINPDDIIDYPKSQYKKFIKDVVTGTLERSNLIEDACQSLGAKVKNIPVGLQGIAGVFSFYATKIITSAGQGGMIVSKDKSLIKEINKSLEVN